jgi:Na(+)/H(+) antiporter
MAWDHLSINRPHLVYIILGGFTSLFMLCSSFIKERLYIGEATVATICGIIFGPHAANLIDPSTWGNVDQITLEFSRIVLVVQCFAVGVELPKYYMEKHWKSVVFLLLPVMTFGWLITSVFVWWMIPPLTWLHSLCVAACVTATDPVLASSVVGKGKFAKRVPKHLRDLLSAESGCNDGMAFPFIYLALYIIHYEHSPKDVAFHWIVVSVLYECVFGAIYGFVIGYIGRRGIRWAEEKDLVDRESFLVFYFVLALFCAGSGSILGVDDLLVGFAAGVGFSNDGWFTQKTEESHVSNVIDLLLNLAYFVYFGTIIPWDQFNSPELGLTPWRLVVIAILVIFFRRIPIMMALKPIIPDIHTWREALFAGHFGPIGVGAIFVAILARADLETESTTPLAELPSKDHPEYLLIALVWPIVCFLVIASIIVHGSSIAVFTLGKHINTLTLTMSYTKATEDGPSWMNRLPRIQSQSKSMSKMSDTDVEEPRLENLPPGSLPPVGMPGVFLRRQKEEDTPNRSTGRASSLVSKRRKKSKWDQYGPGGPISQSAITPQRRTQSGNTSTTLTPENSESPVNGEHEKNEEDWGEVQPDTGMEEMHRGENSEKRDEHRSDAERYPERINTYLEGDDIITENADGDVIGVRKVDEPEDMVKEQENAERFLREGVKVDDEHDHMYKNLRKKLGVWRHKDDAVIEAGKGKEKKRGAALAYQFGNTVSF